MAKRSYPRDRLTAAEADAVRALIFAHGEETAARMVGLSDTRSLYKAVAQVAVHRLTARVIRASLGLPSPPEPPKAEPRAKPPRTPKPTRNSALKKRPHVGAHAKLAARAAKIRELAGEGIDTGSIAERFGVTVAAIGRVLRQQPRTL